MSFPCFASRSSSNLIPTLASVLCDGPFQAARGEKTTSNKLISFFFFHLPYPHSTDFWSHCEQGSKQRHGSLP